MDHEFKVNDRVLYPHEKQMLEWKISAINDDIATIKGTVYRIVDDVSLSELRKHNPIPTEVLNKPPVKTKKH